jgi:hypothetical protein
MSAGFQARLTQIRYNLRPSHSRATGPGSAAATVTLRSEGKFTYAISNV